MIFHAVRVRSHPNEVREWPQWRRADFAIEGLSTLSLFP
jgi:hypothetical protein